MKTAPTTSALNSTLPAEMRSTGLATRLVINEAACDTNDDLAQIIGMWLNENDSAALWHIELQFQRVFGGDPRIKSLWSEGMKRYLEAK